MSVKFLNQNITVNSTRPAGYKFPVGLTQATPANTVVDYLVVAGGAAAGSPGTGGPNNGGSGGGGGGGFLAGSNFIAAKEESYTITVGAGGTATQGDTKGGNGSYSLITTSPSNTIYSYAVGGGGGASGQGSPGSNVHGNSGGSGGGGGYSNGSGGLGTPGQGNNGGLGGSIAGGAGGGGGGGAGSVGQSSAPAPDSAGTNQDSAGGNGLSSSLSGSTVYYAGGGAGGGPVTQALGGAYPNPTLAPGGGGAVSSGSPNTGGGGGGTYGGNPAPGTPAPSIGYGYNGGKGIVIIRYTDAFGNTATGGNVTTSAGYTIHTFTGDGTFATNADFGGANTFSIN